MPQPHSAGRVERSQHTQPFGGRAPLGVIRGGRRSTRGRLLPAAGNRGRRGLKALNPESRKVAVEAAVAAGLISAQGAPQERSLDKLRKSKSAKSPQEVQKPSSLAVVGQR